MGAEDAKKFVELVYSDKKLRDRMKATKTKDEKKKISDDLGLFFSKEDMEKALSAKTELSDEDLDAVAGGGSAVWVGVISGIVGGTVGTGIAAVGAGAAVVGAFAASGWQYSSLAKIVRHC